MIKLPILSLFKAQAPPLHKRRRMPRYLIGPIMAANTHQRQPLFDVEI